MRVNKYTFDLVPEPDGGYSILCLDYKGIVSQADHESEVIPMATEALELMITDENDPKILAGTKIKKPGKNQFQLVVNMDTRKVIDVINP